MKNRNTNAVYLAVLCRLDAIYRLQFLVACLPLPVGPSIVGPPNRQ